MAAALSQCEFSLTQLQLPAGYCALHHEEASWRRAGQQVLDLTAGCWNDVCHLAACCTQMLEAAAAQGGGQAGSSAAGLRAGTAAEALSSNGTVTASQACSGEGQGQGQGAGSAAEAEAAGAVAEQGRQLAEKQQEQLQQLLAWREAVGGSSSVAQLQQLEQCEQQCVSAVTAVMYSPACIPEARVPQDLLDAYPALRRKAEAWQAVLQQQQQQGAAAVWPAPLEVMPGYSVELSELYRQQGGTAGAAAGAAGAAGAAAAGAAAGAGAAMPVGLDLPYITSQLELQTSPAVRRLAQQQGLAALGTGVAAVLPALQLVHQQLAELEGADSYAHIR